MGRRRWKRGSAPAWLLAGYSQPMVFLLPSVLPPTNSYRAALGHGVVALVATSPWMCCIPMELHPPPLLSPFRSLRGFEAGGSGPLWKIAAALSRSQPITVPTVPCSHHSGVAAPPRHHTSAPCLASPWQLTGTGVEIPQAGSSWGLCCDAQCGNCHNFYKNATAKPTLARLFAQS